MESQVWIYLMDRYNKMIKDYNKEAIKYGFDEITPLDWNEEFDAYTRGKEKHKKKNK